MSLIAMAVYDTEENKRSEYTRRVLKNLLSTVNFDKHRIIVVDNSSCQKTKDIYEGFVFGGHIKWSLILNDNNVGTASAINQAWKSRLPGEHCIKMDNDVIVNYFDDWVDEMEEAIQCDPLIGQVGLKRKDCWENPFHPDPHYRSELKMLAHEPGEKWKIVEKVPHVMGTCVMHSSALLDKVGYLYQPHLYGFDDALMSFRSAKAGFYNCFLPHIEIDHIDTGDTPYQAWKESHASQSWLEYQKCIDGYKNGTKSIYYNPYES